MSSFRFQPERLYRSRTGEWLTMSQLLQAEKPKKSPQRPSRALPSHSHEFAGETPAKSGHTPATGALYGNFESGFRRQDQLAPGTLGIQRPFGASAEVRASGHVGEWVFPVLACSQVTKPRFRPGNHSIYPIRPTPPDKSHHG